MSQFGLYKKNEFPVVAEIESKSCGTGYAQQFRDACETIGGPLSLAHRGFF